MRFLKGISSLCIPKDNYYLSLRKKNILHRTCNFYEALEESDGSVKAAAARLAGVPAKKRSACSRRRKVNYYIILYTEII